MTNEQAQVVIRAFTEADVAAMSIIHVSGWRTAYASFLPAEFLERISYDEDREDFWAWLVETLEPPLGFVAETGGEVVGFALAGPNEGDPPAYDSEVYKLFVKPEFQGRGIGKRLLDTAMDALLAHGYHRVAIWAYREGESCRFYERLGGQVVFRTSQTVGGRQTDVVVFGFELEPPHTRSGRVFSDQ